MGLDKLRQCRNKRELASAIDIKYSYLTYNLYKRPDEDRYKTFYIPKRDGRLRVIYAPATIIKCAQRNIANILTSAYKAKPCVHGYNEGTSIKTNALLHANKKIVVNIDLSDFFPSINFGRVRGLFLSAPFLLNEEVATFLAQICCYNKVLPQGAPSSPIISNYICYRLDYALVKYASRNKMHYTRYADDITLSTNLKEIPRQIGEIIDGKLKLNQELINIIEKNGFAINNNKVRYAYRNNRQEVTGLIVNSKVNVPRKLIRQVRAMLHAWAKFGLSNASKEHFEKYNYKYKNPESNEVSFKKELSGKLNYIGYIKGYSDRIYQNLYSEIKKIDTSIKLTIPDSIKATSYDGIVFCEGRTDVIHLRAALNYFKNVGLYRGLNIWIYDRYKDDLNINNSQLYQACSSRGITKKSDRYEIFLFDSDDNRYNVKNLTDGVNDYKNWGNKVYSVLLPNISIRSHGQLCIELYYSDKDFMTEDNDGRRLYLTSEFDPKSGDHKTKKLYYKGNRQKLAGKIPDVIDNDVLVIGTDKNVALSKMDFAKHIEKRKGNFADISFEHFEEIFNVIENIIYPRRD